MREQTDFDYAGVSFVSHVYGILPRFGPFLSQVADQLAAEQRLLEAEVRTVGTLGDWKVAGRWLVHQQRW